MAATCTGTDQTPPQVFLTSPFPGSAQSGTVTLSATASDDVDVVKVDFFLGEHLIGSDSTAPHELIWNSANVSNGSATVTAKASDANCNQTVSAPVDITIQNAGNAAFEPLRGAPICSVVGNKCDSVELLDGRGSLGPEPHSPNTLGSSCADGNEGTYHSSPSLDRFVVFQSDGTAFAAGSNTSAPSIVSIIVDNDITPPQTTLTSPASGATVKGTVTIQATASDDRQVAQVEFYLNGIGYWTITAAPYIAYWNTKQMLNGSYTLTSKAYDASGNSTTSAPVTVVVNNPGTAHSDPVLGVPRCDTSTEYCDSLSLLLGRGPSRPEENAPNTLDGCQDGSVGGGYHDLESIEQIMVSSTDYQPMAAGKQVEILVNVWAYSRGYSTDSLDLYYTADALHPSWTYLTTTTAPYSVSWGLLTIPKGNHTLTAKAYDAAGNVTTSSAITVKVN